MGATFVGGSPNHYNFVFQSSPTPKGGRYGGLIGLIGSIGMFQSSPTPKGGRYDLRASSRGSDFQFQSSPTPKGGRYLVTEDVSESNTKFQSSPTPKGGRYKNQGVRPHNLQLVSILAHPERWALLLSPGHRADPGDVSILAHPERWALR